MNQRNSVDWNLLWEEFVYCSGHIVGLVLFFVISYTTGYYKFERNEFSYDPFLSKELLMEIFSLLRHDEMGR